MKYTLKCVKKKEKEKNIADPINSLKSVLGVYYSVCFVFLKIIILLWLEGNEKKKQRKKKEK